MRVGQLEPQNKNALPVPLLRQVLYLYKCSRSGPPASHAHLGLFRLSRLRVKNTQKHMQMLHWGHLALKMACSGLLGCRQCAPMGCSSLLRPRWCAQNGRSGLPRSRQCARKGRSSLLGRPQCNQNGRSGMLRLWSVCSKRLSEPASVPPVRSKRLFERAVRDRCSQKLVSVALCSEPLHSALLCSVHGYARVHTSIYIYILV